MVKSGKSTPIDPGYLQSTSPINYPQEDEISLYDLWKVLVARRWIILFFILVAFSAASVHIWRSQPIFKAEVLFLPPDTGDVLPLINIYRDHGTQITHGIQEFSVDSIYKLFERNLRSRAIQHTFFYPSDIDTALHSKANKTSVDYAPPVQCRQGVASIGTRKVDKDILVLALHWSNAAQAAECANAYAQHVMRFTAGQLVRDAQKIIGTRITNVENNITARRRMASQLQMDRITVLKEALTIANAIDLIELSPQPLGNNNQVVTTVVGGGDLYMRGSRLLSAELEVLKGRKSADAFVPGLRNLQKELELVKAIQLDPAQIRVARLDQPANPPSSPLKPNRKLILALGVVLGLLLGVFVAFFANFLEKHRVAEQ